MIHRYSSRRGLLKDSLAIELQDARPYDRIAGFFSSSLLEVAGEALERMKPEDDKACVRVVCNSCLNPPEVQSVRAAKWGMHRELRLAPRRDWRTHEGKDREARIYAGRKGPEEQANEWRSDINEGAKINTTLGNARAYFP